MAVLALPFVQLFASTLYQWGVFARGRLIGGSPRPPFSLLGRAQPMDAHHEGGLAVSVSAGTGPMAPGLCLAEACPVCLCSGREVPAT